MRSTGAIVLVVVLLLVAFAGCAGCGTYNSLVQKDEQVNTEWADLQSQYQRRADLIQNLVNTVKGSATFEQETLESVTNARARATGITLSAEDLDDPAKVQQFQEAQAQLSGSLGRLLVAVEAYPELQTTAAFRDLMVQLEGTENRIQVARQDYNQAVQTYNTSVRTFPAALFAGIMGFDQRTPFEADEGAEDAPTVDFGS